MSMCVCVCVCINPRHLGYSAVVPFLACNSEDVMLKIIYFTHQKMSQNNFPVFIAKHTTLRALYVCYYLLYSFALKLHETLIIF
jgi:hypothetical protein